MRGQMFMASFREGLKLYGDDMFAIGINAITRKVLSPEGCGDDLQKIVAIRRVLAAATGFRHRKSPHA
jgi:hypothetical protein